MDAANYISTLDSLELLPQEPFHADYAVIDLAVDDRLLQFIYEADQQGTVQWWSLLENTRWQASWKTGPVLLSFDNDGQFLEKLKARLVRLPLGILIASPESWKQVFDWAQWWLLGLAELDERLFRFYDPRSFRPLLAMLAEHAKQWVFPGATIHWYSGTDWQGYQSPDHWWKSGLPRQPLLAQAELSELPAFRSADRAMAYEKVYRNYLPETGDRRIWVLEQLQEASDLGFATPSLQERWLRLNIRIGSSLLGNADFQEIMKAPDMTPADRLNAMESLSESTDVSA